MTVRTVTTVTVAAGDYDLVALDDLKADLQILDDTEDDYLARAISKASAAVAQYCNRVFAVETVQDVIDIERDSYPWQLPGGIGALQASRWPITALTSVTEDGTALVQDTDFRMDAARGQFLRLSPFTGSVVPWPSLPVTLIYSAGFATIPLDLQDAVTTVVKSLRANRTRDPLLRSENILNGLYAYTLFDGSQVAGGGGTADQVALALDNYRIPVIG